MLSKEQWETIRLALMFAAVIVLPCAGGAIWISGGVTIAGWLFSWAAFLIATAASYAFILDSQEQEKRISGANAMRYYKDKVDDLKKDIWNLDSRIRDLSNTVNDVFNNMVNRTTENRVAIEELKGDDNDLDS